MAQQTLLNEVQMRAEELSKHAQVTLLKLMVLQAEAKQTLLPDESSVNASTVSGLYDNNALSAAQGLGRFV